MSFMLLMAATAAMAAGAGWFAARRSPKSDAGADDKDDHDDKRSLDKKGDGDKSSDKRDDKREPNGAAASLLKKPARKAKKESAFDGLPLALGDVVTGEGEERWLAGALVLREDDKVVSCVFVAPEGSEVHAVAVFAKPRSDIYWLKPASIEAPEEPPATIEIDGVALRRKGRIPVRVERLGQGAPSLAETALFATYDAGAREVAIVITSKGGKAWSWSGIKLEEEQYERLGGGGD